MQVQKAKMAIEHKEDRIAATILEDKNLTKQNEDCQSKIIYCKKNKTLTKESNKETQIYLGVHENKGSL